MLVDPVSEENATKVERIEGRYMYLSGHPHPYKGIPTNEALIATNKVKKGLKRGRILTDLEPFFLPKELQTEATRAIYSIARTFLPDKKSNTIAHIFEYDQAYRFRLQDLAREVKHPQKPVQELWRIFNIFKDRDESEIKYKRMTKKFAFPLLLISFALLLPPIRKKAQEAAKHLKDLYPDENDIYWMGLKQDYRYGGR